MAMAEREAGGGSSVRRLVISPHMDDESMGCGGLLAKYPNESVVVSIADSGPVRAAENVQAMSALGVTAYENLGYRDGAVGQQMAELVRVLDEKLAQYRPTELYLPFPSLHQDHIAVYEAGMRTARISMQRDHWVPRAVFVYDIAAYDVNLYPSDLRWNVFETLTIEQVSKKEAACAAYVSESPTGIHPINSVRELASATGHVRLIAFAEQYALVRQVRS
jgi:LmbE family N-acetylglucosaminyl deacetylase